MILNHFGKERWEKCRMTQIGHSKLFWTILVGKDGKCLEFPKFGLKRWKKCGMTKIANANQFTTAHAN